MRAFPLEHKKLMFMFMIMLMLMILMSLVGTKLKEDHEVATGFTKKIAADTEGIKKKTYTVMGKDVTFSFDLLPGDIKFLAYINGELSNSAKYFSSFAYVCQDESSSLAGKFGKTQNCKWSPWQYSQRIVNAQQVADFKRKLPGHLAEKTKRAKVTQFIAGKKSRHEFQPFIGKLCEKEVVETLHLSTPNTKIFFSLK